MRSDRRRLDSSWRLLLPTALAMTLGCGDSDGSMAPTDEGQPPVAGCQEGTLGGTGALYRTCFPQNWNGDLLVFAHGYVEPGSPLEIVDYQIGGSSISTQVTSLGYAFATTSYRATGLVAADAVEDLVDLEETVRRNVRPDPGRSFIVGASEGGLVAALTVEQYPDRFAGAVALCGPIGDFARQLDYFGDFRVVFDYFFPGVLPGSAVEIPDQLRDGWTDVYVPAVLQALAADPAATTQLLAVTGAPADPADIATIGATVVGVLWYNVFATGDARQRLGGQPYDNATRSYQGSSDDGALNQGVARLTADPAARAAIGRFETTGQLTIPLVTLHTTGDPIVPFFHQARYAEKVADAGASGQLGEFAVERYGHCTFTRAELLAAFSSLLDRAAAASRHAMSR
ncbi:MAG: alpha/beta hydrolase family protein [Gemmatimonadales bacterium]